MFSNHAPVEGSLEEPLSTLADLQRKGLIKHIGLSNVTPLQVVEGRKICDIVCVQNHYNLVHRTEDAFVDDLAKSGTAYVPFFPLGGFKPIQSDALAEVAADIGTTSMQVALAWLLQRSPNILLIPGTSSLGHLHENLQAASLTLSADTIAKLNAIESAAGH
jgi:aryl-alcohol dehydrogenase-like predicted oxidoreductase